MKLTEVAPAQFRKSITDPETTLLGWLQRQQYERGAIRPGPDTGGDLITSFGDCSKIVIDGGCFLNQTNITSLEGMPKVIRGSFDIRPPSIQSLHHIHKHAGVILGTIFTNSVSNMLGLFFYPGSKIWLPEPDLYRLFKQYCTDNKGEYDIHDFQEALIEAGFKEQAKL